MVEWQLKGVFYMPTIFEKIIAREIPAHIVFEDEQTIAFLDITQATKGHTLIVPKAPYPNLYEMPSALAGHVMEVAVKIANAIKEAFEPEGLNLLNNNGTIAGQTVFHFHIHLIPRYEKKDIAMSFTNHMNELNEDDFIERADRIKAALS